MGKHRDDSARARRALATRDRIITVATELFAEQGYAATALDEICAGAEVTKGALYHHFADKQAVFLAVYEMTLADVAANAQRIGESTPGGDRVAVFVDGCVWFVERAVAAPALVRLLITEGPVALGERGWRELDDRFVGAEMERRLASLQARGLLRADVDMAAAARLVNAAVNEAALRVVLATDPDAECATATRALRALVDGLRAGRAANP